MMKQSFDRLFSFLLFLSGSLFSSHAQRLPVTVYRPTEEAQTSAITSILQDQDGWIWACNNNELLKYDGSRFTSFKKSKTVQHAVLYNCFDAGKKIWVDSDKGTLAIQNDSLVPIRIRGKDPEVQLMYSWGDHGNLFLGRDGLYQVLNNTWIPFLTEPGLDLRTTNPRFVPISNRVAFTYLYNKALVLFDAAQKKIQFFPIPVLDVLQDNGQLYLLTNSGDVLKLSDIKNNQSSFQITTAQLFNTGIREEKNMSFLKDKKGNFWITAQFQHLVKADSTGELTRYGEKDGLPGLWFSNMFFDREENLWISYYHGICKIGFGGKNRFTEAEGLWSNYSSFVKEDTADHLVWVGTKNGLNIYRNNKIEKVFDVDGQPFLCEDILIHQHQYFGFNTNKLFALTFNRERTRVTGKQYLTVLPDRISDMAITPNGCLLFSTKKGIYAWYKNRLFTLLEDGRHYRKLFIDHQGKLWAGILDGELLLYRILYHAESVQLNLENWFVSRQENNPDPPKHIRVIIQDEAGTIWVGTRFSGLYYFKENKSKSGSWKIRQLTVSEGLSGNEVWGLSVKKQVLWIATSNGINTIRTLDSAYQILNESRSRQIFSVESIAATENDLIVTGAYPGMLSFNASQKDPNEDFATYITKVGLHTKDSSIYYTDHFPAVFDYSQHNLTVNFSANTFISEERVQYSYKLENNGIGQWSVPAGIHTLSFSSLSPGKYKLTIKARNVFGTWSKEDAVWSFEIRSPFWQRWWFYLVVTCLITLIILSMYFFRVRQLKRVQHLRDNISRNLHDDIGASLSNINILNELTKRHIQKEEDAMGYLNKSSEDIQRISESLSDIVWNINPRYDDLQNLFVRMKRYAADMMDGNNIRYQLEFPDEEEKIHLSMEKRRDLYLVFKEAVNNLAKYSKAGTATIEVKAEKKKIRMMISDDGVGFNAGNDQYGNGILNMRQRARNSGAVLKINSAKDAGTTVILEMNTT